jgi:two-component system sensor histidine kinase BaeS
MPDRRLVLGPTAVRLVLATLAVAVGAIAVLATLTLLATSHDVQQVVVKERHRDATTIAASIADAYRTAGSWQQTDLSAAVALASDFQASLNVFDASGRPVHVATTQSSQVSTPSGRKWTYQVVVGHRHVGTSIVQFDKPALPAAESQLRGDLVRVVALGTGLAVVLALSVAFILSAWITKPIAALSRAVRSMAAGDRSARVGVSGGRGELAELATAFDRMADTIAWEDKLRRSVTSDVAHELRTPLAILQATTESLADGSTAPTREELSSLHEEVLRLARTVEDLDALASAEAASVSIHKKPSNLAELANLTIDALHPLFDTAQVTLDSDLQPTKVLVDSHRVDQILTNLLTNALKFTPAGGAVTVTVAPDNGAALLEVVDTGCGIPADDLPNVFDRFWRGRHAEGCTGSGIGLSLVRSLVDAHSGTIRVTSEPMQGTRVLVRFPSSNGRG